VSVADLRAVVERLAEVITVVGGRRAGDPETRVHLDHLIPSPSALQSGPARWRLASSNARLYPPPVARGALAVWHSADGVKGRRLLATDVANNHQVAAILSWHFEPAGRGRGARPHLVTSSAIREGAGGRLREDYLLALWLLFCTAGAIDLLTVRRDEVGLVRDNAIHLSLTELGQLGLAPGRRRAGYAGDYWVFPLSLR
jgi:hypothetical protein